MEEEEFCYFFRAVMAVRILLVLVAATFVPMKTYGQGKSLEIVLHSLIHPPPPPTPTLLKL